MNGSIQLEAEVWTYRIWKHRSLNNIRINKELLPKLLGGTVLISEFCCVLPFHVHSWFDHSVKFSLRYCERPKGRLFGRLFVIGRSWRLSMIQRAIRRQVKWIRWWNKMRGLSRNWNFWKSRWSKLQIVLDWIIRQWLKKISICTSTDSIKIVVVRCTASFDRFLEAWCAIDVEGIVSILGTAQVLGIVRWLNDLDIFPTWIMWKIRTWARRADLDSACARSSGRVDWCVLVHSKAWCRFLVLMSCLALCLVGFWWQRSWCWWCSTARQLKIILWHLSVTLWVTGLKDCINRRRLLNNSSASRLFRLIFVQPQILLK